MLVRTPMSSTRFLVGDVQNAAYADYPKRNTNAQRLVLRVMRVCCGVRVVIYMYPMHAYLYMLRR